MPFDVALRSKSYVHAIANRCPRAVRLQPGILNGVQECLWLCQVQTGVLRTNACWGWLRTRDASHPPVGSVGTLLHRTLVPG